MKKFTLILSATFVLIMVGVYKYYPKLSEHLDVSGIQSTIKKAEQGDAFSQNELATRYLRGDGVEKSEEKAIYFYQKAADQGNIDARYKLGLIYKNGEERHRDLKKAIQYIQEAATQGSEHAQNELGQLYEHGNIVPQDFAMAVEFYTKAANQNLGSAMISLAKLYLSGQNITKNVEKAIELLTKATKLGYPEGSAYPEAFFLLGEIYDKGNDVPVDKAKAEEFFKLAAEKGYEPANEKFKTFRE